MAEKNISADVPNWDTSVELIEKTSKNLKLMVEDIMKNRANYPEGTTESDVANLYETVLDREGREKVGLGPLESYLKSVQSADSIFSYLMANAAIQKDLGKSTLLAFESNPDPMDSSRYSLFMNEPTLLLTKEELDSPEAEESLQIYMADLLTANGMDKNQSEAWSKKLLQFHIDLNKTVYSMKLSDDPSRINNPFTMEQIQSKISNMDVSAFLNASGLNGYKSWYVTNPDMLPVINNYLTPNNLELLKQYTSIVLLNEYAPYLNQKFIQAKATFDQSDTDDNETAWQTFENFAEMDLGELYIKRFFSAEKKQAVEQITQDIVKAYKENIKNLDWMSEKSRSEAIKKLDTLNTKIGYPESYPNWSRKAAVKSPEAGGSLISNVVAIHRVMAENNLKKSSNPVDHSEWGMPPQAVNAYYDPTGNEIVLPAAMIQAPFYDEKASYAQNLGGIGAVIGHEITHAFDDNGSQYDEKGNLRKWWTDKDYTAFSERTKKAVEYFGNYEVLPGFKVDGELTLGENIADLGSISTIASILGDDINALKEMFRNYSISWRGKYPEETLKELIETDEHSPSKIRVNAVLSSTDAFYKAYDVKPEDKMYVAPEKRVKIY